MLSLLSAGVLLALLAFLLLCWYNAWRVVHPARQAACQTPSNLSLEAERVEFQARDGIRLRGWWLPARRPRGTVIFSHGFSGDCSPDLQYGRWLTGIGYNLLLFDHRAHGASEGRVTTLGAVETRDLLGAIDFLKTRGIERVGVMGFSMGGSVVLQTAPLSDAISCVVADCTFASLYSLLEHHVRRARVPAPLAPAVSAILVTCMSIQAGVNLFAHSPEKSIGQIAPRPVLLIQAGRDELVPESETRRLYVAAREPKELWCVEEAGHRSVDQIVREEYEQRITAFFDRYLAEGSDPSPIPLQIPASETAS